MIALSVWLSIATNLDPVFERVLRYRFGLSYQDLPRFEWWRIVTSPVIEPRAGFVWTNLLLLVVVLPLAERRLHTLRTVTIFFVGDIVASLSILFVLRVAGSLGNDVALVNSMMRDAGPSAGCWALVAALATTIRAPRRRWIVTTALFVGLAGAVIVFGRLFDVQHLMAAALGAILGVTWGARTATTPRDRRPPSPEPRAAPQGGSELEVTRETAATPAGGG
jgi:membrane associated rhomboid family serine protease